MKKKVFKLTRSETEIMDLLWKEGRPLSRSEIIELTPDRSWKPSSIHILLNSMLDKEASKVSGCVQSTKNYARTFSPTMTADEYAIMQIKDRPGFEVKSIPHLMAALMDDEIDSTIIKELEALIQNKKETQ